MTFFEHFWIPLSSSLIAITIGIPWLLWESFAWLRNIIIPLLYIGWFMTAFAGLTGGLFIGWFIWVIPLSLIVLLKFVLDFTARGNLMPACKFCYDDLPDWHELAIHIRDAKTGHAKGKRWAASFLLKARFLNQKRDMPERSPMSNEEKIAVKEAKEETRRDLSGEVKLVMTLCPNCKTASKQAVPVEYADSPSAWRTGSGVLYITCMNCRR